MGVLSPPEHTTETSPSPHTPFHSPLLKREMPGLDILRGIAVLAVVMYHGLSWWLPMATVRSAGVQRLAAMLTPGWLGVNLFFVLSGFLITGILIETRLRTNYWKSFYVRRVLRILPLYLVVLLVLKLIGGFTWGYLALCLLYLANFTASMGLESYGPLWSLAVEEQFYLVWPFLVRRLGLRTLAVLCAVCILLSPALRYLSVSRILPLGDPYTATWLVSDNLATGAMLAILLRTPAATLLRMQRLTVGLLAAGTIFLLIGFHFHAMARGNSRGAAFQSEPFLLLSAGLLLLALQYGDKAAVLRVTGPLRFLGYISYGLYLSHLIFFRFDQMLFYDWRHPLPELTVAQVLLRFVRVVGAATVVCYLSRRYFEEYFLRFKDRLVPYAAGRQGPASKYR